MIGWLAMSLGLLALLSFSLNLWQFVVGIRFPLHQRTPNADFTPDLTILKPLKGCDAETEACLRSWLTQHYRGAVQILFGLASADDPAQTLVEKLLGEFPQADAHLIKCPQRLGANSKVSTLMQLEPHARHGLILVSDADVRVPNDLLANVVFPLRNSEVGLVNCFYQLANPSTLAMRCEAIAINADFWSQVLQSRSLKPLDFALGAIMITRRAQLEEIGGFGSLRDYLADDYLLGSKIFSKGYRIELCPVVAECWEPRMDWLSVLRHQLRWARTIRFCKPLPYFFSILGNASLWPLLWLLVYPTNWALGVSVAMLVWRMLSAHLLQYRLTRVAPQPFDASLVLLKDLFGAVIWAGAFLGREISWRGERYQIEAGGRLTTRGTLPNQTVR